MWWGPGADPGEEPPPQQQVETNMKGQFQQQQDQITQLREMLQFNRQQLVDKEKELEQYASTLSDIKSRRSKASKRRSAGKKHETSGSQIQTEERKEDTSESQMQTPTQVLEQITPEDEISKEEIATPKKSGSDKMRQGNLVLLRKQLEENRVKFEQRGREISENKKGIEEMVQHLKAQLDERDITIQELQRGLEAHQSPASKMARLETSKEKESISLLTEYSNLPPEEMHTQIVYRDRKIDELNQRVVGLETTILDLEENFREKDSVIDARTKAIALMSEDFSRRNKTTLDSLEETREEMRKMQNNFVSQEMKMKGEVEELKNELAAKVLRLHQLEESNKSLETVRFDLSTRNAELQEKVVRVQVQNSELQKQVADIQEKPESEKEKDDKMLEDIKTQLEDANKQIVKLKAQHKGKVKSLNKQLDGLRKMSDANEEILKLQNRIAELEEDKGNLQLHLVDFDELKVSESHWQTRVSELEERVSQQSQDLDCHVHMISLLEAEKLEHLQSIHSEKGKLSALEEELQKMKNTLSDLENQKVSLEMKTVDLEEQVDVHMKEKVDLQEEVTRLNQVIEDHSGEKLDKSSHFSTENNLLQSVELVEKQEEERPPTSLNVSIEDRESIGVEQLQAELLKSKQLIEEQKEIIIDLQSKVESREEELELQHDLIAKLEHLSEESDKEDRISEIVKELSEMASDLEEWKKRCREVEQRLQDLEEEKTLLEERFKEVKMENSVLNEHLAEQKEIAGDLSDKLREQGRALAGRDESISSLQSLLEMNGQTLEAREMTLKDVHEKLNLVEKQFESRNSELKLSLAKKEEELLDITATLSDQDNILKDKEIQVMSLEETLQRQNQELLTLQHHLSTMEENISQQFRAQLDELSGILLEKDRSNNELTQQCQLSSQKLNDLSAELSDKIQYIRKLEMASETVAELELQLKSSESNLQLCQDEMNILKQELASKQSEIEDRGNKQKDLEVKVTELTEKSKKYVANLKAKTVSIKGHEQKIQQYEEIVQAKESLISELKSQIEKNVEQQYIKNSDNMDEQMRIIDNLNKELFEERSRTELIAEELGRATEKIVSLENEIKVSETKIHEMTLVEELQSSLSSKVSELEREIGLMQREMRNKDDRILLLEEEKVRASEELNESLLKERGDMVEYSEFLKEKIKELEADLAKHKVEQQEVEILQAEKKSLMEKVFDSNEYSARVSELENTMRDRDVKVSELEEQLFSVSERNQQSLSAVEAKLQEREAVVESLEQELFKAMERVHHLEENLAFVEERRQSLENKAEDLNVRLQESDRVKEEVVENEEILEHRLEALIASEEGLKKKVEDLNLGNEESTQRVTEFMTENVELKREIVNMEITVKGLQKELERLSPFEYSFTHATEKIDTLEAELKRVVIEFEHRMKGKVHEMRQNTDSLETDLRNMNSQLEQVELEKRTLMEQYEKLNDEKINLEDEVESLNNTVTIYTTANTNLKFEIQEKSTAFETSFVEKERSIKELEERVQILENELQNQRGVCEEKEYLSNEMNNKINYLEEELKVTSSAAENAVVEKDQLQSALNAKIVSLEKELEGKVSAFEIISIERETLQKQIEELACTTVQTPSNTEISGSTVYSGEDYATINAELDHMKSVLQQKDVEIKNYQTRLLQLQFGSVPSGQDSGAVQEDKILHLEALSTKFQDELKARELQVSEISACLSASNTELEQLKSELTISKDEVVELRISMNILQEDVMNKNNYIQQLQNASTEIPVELSSELDTMRNDYEAQVTSLRQQTEDLHKELLMVRAQQEISKIVRCAEGCVQALNPISETVHTTDQNHASKAVTFEESAESVRIHSQESKDFEKYEVQIMKLQADLQAVETERDEALLRIQELSSIALSPPVKLVESVDEMKVKETPEDQLYIAWRESDENLMKVREFSSSTVPTSTDSSDRTQTFQESCLIQNKTNIPWDQSVERAQNLDGSSICTSVTTQQHLPSSESDTILTFEPSNWDVIMESEEEGWGWGSDEARLEEEHIQKQQQTLLNSEPSTLLNDHIIALEDQIKDMEMEKEKLSEELRNSQVRSGKMLKKLKELKLKNDNLLKENIELAKKGGDKHFSDLNEAIEEELKIRIDELEKELKEVKNDRDSVFTEKEGLETRIDMLSSANERFLEMKERQDMDIEVWKQRNRDLANQVQSLEWRVGELTEEKNSVVDSNSKAERDSFFSWDKHSFGSESGNVVDLEASIKDLQEQVAALSSDNENLQVLLEQQRNLRLTAEAEIQKLQQSLSLEANKLQFHSESEHILLENTTLKKQLEELHLTLQGRSHLENFELLKEEYDRLLEENNNLQNSQHALKMEYDRVCKESEECVISAEKKIESLELEYGEKIEAVCNEKLYFEEQLKNVVNERNLLTDNVQKLSENLEALNRNLESVILENNSIREHLTIQEKSLAFANEQKLSLQHELIQLKSHTETDSSGSNSSSNLLIEMQMRITQLEQELRDKMDEVEHLRQLIESLKLEQSQVEQEWNNRVEKLRKEFDFNAEELHKQHERYCMLAKEHEELQTHKDELIEYRVLEVLNSKDQEIQTFRTQLAEKDSLIAKQHEFGVEHISVKEDVDNLKQKLNESADLLITKEKDIENLKRRLTEKEQEMEGIINVRSMDSENYILMISENNKQFENVLGQKNQDIYNLQVQLSEKDSKINELQSFLEEESKQLEKLQNLLTDKEWESMQLKDKTRRTTDILSRDASHASLHDSSSGSVNVERGERKDSISSNSEQGELDLALYLLHQRDVRCDELTLELMQLLEERDTLQLRLSNALRLNEELRSRSRPSSTPSPTKTVLTAVPISEHTIASISQEESPQHVLATVSLPSITSTAAEPHEDLEALANKLSQLRSVGYRRDVTLRDEQEQRHNEQVRMLHQRGSGIVVDANYTLSRDVQSPSTVLLNWLWGRSTPRVMHV